MKKILEKIFSPNKQFELLFKLIDAKGILKKYSNNEFKMILSVSKFYQLREDLISAMYNKDKNLLEKRLDVLTDYKSQFGMWWIISMYKDTYNIKIRVFDSF